ncbi:FAD-dependent oxidoreductase [Thalassotalea aquiviva]|uniref:FAD-dependent oxidoreductase n=1 Tax=Thalassotalea aquiviva TaxID=3242415 RepID=UPI00352B6E3A
MKKIVIVGGVAGGASAAARARRLSESADIIMFERGPYVSFANCGLPYHIGGDIRQREALILQTDESFDQRFNVKVKSHTEVMAIDRENKRVRVTNLLTQEQYEQPYDVLLLSPGAKPLMPPITGLTNPYTFSLRNIPDMDAIIAKLESQTVKHATVVGGGFIGLEMLEAFHQRGIDTTLVELADQVMVSIDKEMAGFVHAELNERGIDLKLSQKLVEVQSNEAHTGHNLTLQLDSGQQVLTDMLIMATGVAPETGLAKQAGLKLGELGGIWVNGHMQTSDPSIYAVGDAIETIDFVTKTPTLVPLAGPANRQGRMAADNMLGASESYQGTQGTAICKVFDLAVGSTGKNEKQLKRANIAYEKVYVHTASHASYYPGAEIVSLKLLFAPDTGIILGAQAVGKDGVDKRIDVLSVAMKTKMTVAQLQHVELCYAPPFGSAKDVINQAAFVATNILRGDIKPVHFDQVDNVTSKQLWLDVRKPIELERVGQIAGAINIEVDELRQRLNELPKDKEILVYCQVGLRGNVACRMLANHGFKVKNLVGGYRTYLFSQK